MLSAVTRGHKRVRKVVADEPRADGAGAGAGRRQATSFLSPIPGVLPLKKKRKHNVPAASGVGDSPPIAPSAAASGGAAAGPAAAVASISMTVEQVIEWMYSNFPQPAIAAQYSKYAQNLRDNGFDGYAMCDMCDAADPAAEFAELIDNRSHAGRMQRLWKRQSGMHTARMSVMTV